MSKEWILVFLFLPLFVFAQNDTLVMIDEFSAPSPNSWGIIYDSGNLWVSDDSLGNIYRIDLEGNIVDSIHVLNCRVKGMTLKDDELWIINDDIIEDTLRYIYQIDKSNGSIIDSIGIAENNTVWGLIYFNSMFYVSYNGGWGPCMYEIDPITHTVTNQLCCAHPSGLTVINDSLWCIRENRSDGAGNLVLPLEIYDDTSQENWELRFYIDYYATGITFDGEYFWLCDRDNSKIKKMSRVVATIPETELNMIPLFYELHQNYPNPFNPTTTICFNLPKTSDVELIIDDILGRKVEELVSGQLAGGEHEVVWDAANVASGVYFYRLITNNSSITKKMVLLK